MAYVNQGSYPNPPQQDQRLYSGHPQQNVTFSHQGAPVNVASHQHGETVTYGNEPRREETYHTAHQGSYSQDPRNQHFSHSQGESVKYEEGTRTDTFGHTANSDLRRSDANRNRNSRFKDYVKRKLEYKYNFFSMIDEPWNRCCEVGKCGTCPGNECIAKKNPKLDWIWSKPIIIEIYKQFFCPDFFRRSTL